MKKSLLILSLSFFIALCQYSCQQESIIPTETVDEENGDNDDNHGVEQTGTGSANTSYPSTAIVIKSAIKDIEGNIYDAVQIGNQIWMAENLRTSHYADGTYITTGISDATTPGKIPPGSIDNVPKYGYLYNWPAVMHNSASSESNPSGVQGICPNGWHVPSLAEMEQLIAYMKSNPQYAASGISDHIAKAMVTTWGWDAFEGWGYDPVDCPGTDMSTNNASGFSVPAAGYYGVVPTGNPSSGAYTSNYWGKGRDAHIWSTTQYAGKDSYYLVLSKQSETAAIDYSHDYAGYFSYGAPGNQRYGFSVRCIKN